VDDVEDEELFEPMLPSMRIIITDNMIATIDERNNDPANLIVVFLSILHLYIEYWPPAQ
jgi:hypothetical protein